MDATVQSANFNEKWLNNIFENIKSLEEHERNGREGCASLLVYLGIPEYTKSTVIKDAQFKNLRFFVTEFQLLLSDLTPILKAETERKYRKILNDVDKLLLTKKLFMREVYDLNKNLVDIRFTDLFNKTLIMLSDLKVELFKEIKHILYIQEGTGMAM